MAYLDTHPPARSQMVCPRREMNSGVIVVHTAENTPDFVAFDGGAEAVANFIVGRSDPGSYHDLCDSDSSINLVRYACEAFHDGTGSNRHSYGVSAATRADVWPIAPREWRDGCIRQMALSASRYARWVDEQFGIEIPARRITRAQSEARVPGFISHAERDPARRTDPGAAFPWNQFLTEYAAYMEDDDDMTPDQDRKLDRIAAAVVPYYEIADTRFRVRTHIETELRENNERLDNIIKAVVNEALAEFDWASVFPQTTPPPSE